jgi:hypothetical protein
MYIISLPGDKLTASVVPQHFLINQFVRTDIQHAYALIAIAADCYLPVDKRPTHPVSGFDLQATMKEYLLLNDTQGVLSMIGREHIEDWCASVQNEIDDFMRYKVQPEQYFECFGLVWAHNGNRRIFSQEKFDSWVYHRDEMRDMASY